AFRGSHNHDDKGIAAGQSAPVVIAKRMPERDGRRCPLRDLLHGLTALAFGDSLLIAGGTPAGAQQVVPAPAESATPDEYTVKLTAFPEYRERQCVHGHRTP